MSTAYLAPYLYNLAHNFHLLRSAATSLFTALDGFMTSPSILGSLPMHFIIYFKILRISFKSVCNSMSQPLSRYSTNLSFYCQTTAKAVRDGILQHFWEEDLL